MAVGHYIRLGDRTTCGGAVTAGHPSFRMHGIPVAREWDTVTCGKDGKVYAIAGGIQHFMAQCRVAGTLDSFSTCPCKAQLIHSLPSATYQSDRGATSSAPTAQASSFSASSPANAPVSAAPKEAARFTSAPHVPVAPSLGEPGFYVVPRSMTGEQVLAELAPSNPVARLRLMALNPTFAQGFKAGELFVLGDPEGGVTCTREEAALMLAAAQARTALEPLSASEADFMARHQGEIAGMLGTASLSMGIAHDTYGAGLKQMEGTLRDIELLHQREFAKHGHLRSPEFFASRQQLYRQLDIQLKTTFLNKPLGLGSYETLRRDLGISSRSLVHHWSKAGAPGQIPGYATHLDEVARVAKYLKYGGYVGIALGGAASSLKVQEVCRAGETEACEKIRFTEAGSFAGGVGLGVGAGVAVGAVSTSVCAFIGLGTVGVGGLACGLVLAGGASYLGATGGAWVGEQAGEKLYEAQK